MTDEESEALLDVVAWDVRSEWADVYLWQRRPWPFLTDGLTLGQVRPVDRSPVPPERVRLSLSDQGA